MDNTNITLYRYLRKHGRITTAEAAQLLFIQPVSVRRVFINAEQAYPDDIIRTRNGLAWVVKQ
jgi:hypothetical protein